MQNYSTLTSEILSSSVRLTANIDVTLPLNLEVTSASMRFQRSINGTTWTNLTGYTSIPIAEPVGFTYQTTHTDTDVTNGSTYYYRVQIKVNTESSFGGGNPDIVYLYTPDLVVYYVPYDSSKVIDNLQVTNEPVAVTLEASWSHPPSPGVYFLYYRQSGNWVYSGNSTSSTSISVSNITDSTQIQIRTDNIHPSNTVIFARDPIPANRTLRVTQGYSSSLLTWDPPSRDNISVAIYRNGSKVFSGQAFSYTATIEGTYTAKFYKEAEHYSSDITNGVVVDFLDPPPARVEPSAAASCYIGKTRAGQSVMHICNPSKVPASATTQEGKSAVDWQQDYAGAPVDYGDDTYFHSMFDYVYAVKAVRLNSYVDTGSVRRFSLTSGISDIRTGQGTTIESANFSRAHFIVLIDDNGNRISSNPILTREVKIIEGNFYKDTYSQGFYGYGDNSAFLYNDQGTRQTYINAPRDTVSIEIYYLNIKVNGRDFNYQPQNSSLISVPTPGGADIQVQPDDILITPEYFIVGGNDFGTKMFLSFCGATSPGALIDSMNTSDALIPLRAGVIDSNGYYTGAGGPVLQVLGTTDVSGWNIDMNTGRIWRGNDIFWFNAGRGRTRSRFEGSSGRDSSGNSYQTPSFYVDIPNGTLENDDTYEDIGEADTPHIITLDSEQVSAQRSGIFGITVTPGEWGGSDETWAANYSEDQSTIIFDTFDIGVKTPIYKYYKTVRTGQSYNFEDFEYWNTYYFLEMTLYLRRLDDYRFKLSYDYHYISLWGSARGGFTRAYLPKLSYSFMRLS